MEGFGNFLLRWWGDNETPKARMPSGRSALSASFRGNMQLVVKYIPKDIRGVSPDATGHHFLETLDQEILQVIAKYREKKVEHELNKFVVDFVH